jgi:hypothetical protein
MRLGAEHNNIYISDVVMTHQTLLLCNSNKVERDRIETCDFVHHSNGSAYRIGTTRTSYLIISPAVARLSWPDDGVQLPETVNDFHFPLCKLQMKWVSRTLEKIPVDSLAILMLT